MKTLHRSASSAFTLLEIMLVVMIIALLAGVAIINMQGTLIEAESTKATAQLQQIDTALVSYRAKAGFYPTTEQGLKALVTRPATEPVPRSWSQIINGTKDPWGNDYHYENPGKHNPSGPDVFSAGPDGVVGTEDDVVNWEKKG